MQQNAYLLHRRAPFIVRLRPCLRLPRSALYSSPQCVRHQFQRRCISNTTPRGPLLGDLALPHLGGLHYFRVKIPSGPEQDDIDAWLRALDACLPSHLRGEDSTFAQDRSTQDIATRRDVALLLIQAQKDASLNLLEYLGVVQQRWDAISWIVQTIAQPGLPSDIWSIYPSAAPLTYDKGDFSLDKFTELPMPTGGVFTSTNAVDLDQATIHADPRHYDTRLQRGAMGQIWQSLGSIVIRAAEGTIDTQKMMPHVLGLLATLHHYGIVPESVYREGRHHGIGTVQQPPLLHMLSSKILTALSDAAWDARQAALKMTEKSGRGQYSPWTFGLESPGVRYRASSQELRPEVWLELILWSCLHGGWVEEGAAILEHITQQDEDEEHGWSLICWQRVMDSSSARQTHSPSFGWRDAIDILEGARPELQPRPSADDKALVVRAASSEVMAAYVDAMIGRLHVGVGQRGTRIRPVLDHIKRSKVMLGKQNLGLGFATWDVIVQRLMECGGIWLERDPSVVMEILQLVEPFGREHEAENASMTDRGVNSTSPYFINASALPLNLLHRILYTQAQSGSLEGTMTTLKALQDFTELNQRRSIEQFFRDLKQRPQVYQTAANQGLLFDTGLAAAEYPSFYPQLPVHVLAQFLSVAKDVQDASFSRWVFDSGSAVGPLISEAMYEEAGLAPALVRFASATDNQAVLENVMSHHSQLSQERNALIPTPILTALVVALMQRRKWSAVRNVLTSLVGNYGSDSGNFNVWETRLLALMSRELLRIAHETGKGNPERTEASYLFTDLVVTCLHLPRLQSGFAESDRIYSIVALLAAVDSNWGKFCAKLRVLPQRSIQLRDATDAFNTVLEGVLETRGLAEARKYWELWCHTAEYLRRRAVTEGGIFQVPRLRVPIEHTSSDPSHRVLVQSMPSHDIDLAGRVSPNLHSVRLMQNALRADQSGGNESDYDLLEMRDWLREYVKALNTFKFESAGTLAQLEDAMAA